MLQDFAEELPKTPFAKQLERRIEEAKVTRRMVAEIKKSDEKDM